MLTTLAAIGPWSTLIVLACLLTLVACIRLIRRTHHGRIRKVVALIGVAAIDQALRTLADKGVLLTVLSRLADVGDAVMVLISVVSLLLIKDYDAEQRCTHIRLRLAEASGSVPMGPPAPTPSGH